MVGSVADQNSGVRLGFLVVDGAASPYQVGGLRDKALIHER